MVPGGAKEQVGSRAGGGGEVRCNDGTWIEAFLFFSIRQIAMLIDKGLG